MKPLQRFYADLLTDADYTEIEAESMRLLKSRSEWGLRDAAKSWSEATFAIAARKGLMRPIDLIEAERGPSTVKDLPLSLQAFESLKSK